jgi:SAM-dependent methyltransferase
MQLEAVKPDYQTPERMALKRAATPLPDLAGRRVLDVGCDMGWWCWEALALGAAEAVGLDRGRHVKGVGPVDLVAQNRAEAARRGVDDACRFEAIDLGRQWLEFGRFDVVLCLSMYHHAFERCGSHEALWFWLWRHVEADGVLIWEGPVDDFDAVVQKDMSPENRALYTFEAFLTAPDRWFEGELIGRAAHAPLRQVWRFTPRSMPVRRRWSGVAASGAGGAAKAFAYADGRRIGEIEAILGFRPWPGSLNVKCGKPFDWETGYFRARILDVADRKAGLDGEWAPRWCRFYPVMVNPGSDAPGVEIEAFAMRFEGERYAKGFVELIAPERLRDRLLITNEVSLWRP